MKRRMGISIASVVLCLSGLVFAQAGAATKTVSPSGGSMTFTTAVRDAKTCGWSSSPKIAGFTATVQCTTGIIARTAKFKSNASTRTKSYVITLTVHGKTTKIDHWKVIQAGKTTTTTSTVLPTTATTTTVLPTTTTTTTVPSTSTSTTTTTTTTTSTVPLVATYPFSIVLSGASLYSGPGSNYSDLGGIGNGSAIAIVCQTQGTSVGSSDPTVWWDLLSSSDWVSDYYTNTPVVDGPSPPIPQCTSGQIPVAPVTSPSSPTTYPFSIVLSGASLYSGPGSNYSDLGGIGNGSAIAIVCQTQGTSVGSSDPTVWWDLLSSSDWVSDYYTNTPVVDGPSPPIPQCTSGQIPVAPVTSPTSLGNSIVSIAKSQNGVVQTSPTCAGAYGCTGDGEWCALFVIWVWNQAGAQTSGLTAAADSFASGSTSTYTWHPDQGTSNVPQSGFTPEPGDAIVWSYDGVVQHVGIVNTYGRSMGSNFSINGNWLINGDNPNLYTSWDVNVDTYPDSSVAAVNVGWYVDGYAVPNAG